VTANSVENGKAYRTYVGGVIGFMGEGGHKVSNVTSNIDVIGTTCDVGGIVGIAHYGNIFENVSCSGDVTITNAMEAADAEEMGGIAGVWHNGGSNVVMNNCTFTGTLTANITEGVDLSNNTVAGNAYSTTGTGMLIIDGKDTNGSWVVTDEASFKDALTEGGSTTLYKDLKLSETMVIAEGVEVVLNMNGKTLSATGLDAENAKAAVLKNNGTLTINGGVISSTGTNGGSAVVNNGTLTVVGTTLNGAPNAGESWPSYTVNNTGVMTINNATITSYHGAVASYGAGALVTLNDSTIDMKGIPGFTSHGMYTYNDGKIIVNGGIYANKATDQSASGASVINGNVEVNGGTFTGRIENYYGTPVIKGGTFDNNPTNRVAAGYEVTVNADGTWTVSGAKVGSAADLNAALNSGKVAELTEDIATGSDFTAENTNINLGENTMAMTGSDQKVSGNLTVTNGTVDVSKGYFDIRPANGAEVVIENVVFNNTKKSKTFGSSTDHVESALEFCPVTTEGKTTIIFRNCTFNNAQVLFEAMSGKPGVVDAIFENCTFNNFGNSDAIEVKNYLTINITIKDCTFNITSTSNVAIVDALGSSNVTVNFEGNNVVNGVAATPTTDASLVGTVDEVKVFSTTSVKVVSASVDTVNGLENVTVTGIATK